MKTWGMNAKTDINDPKNSLIDKQLTNSLYDSKKCLHQDKLTHQYKNRPKLIKKKNKNKRRNVKTNITIKRFIVVYCEQMHIKNN